jgi:DNA-binding MarR family transcriptional regulator
MDGDRTEASPPSTVYQVGPTTTRAKIHYLGTGGNLLDPGVTSQICESLLQRLAQSAESVAVLDLGGAVFSPGSLQALLLPLARRLRAGEPRPLALLVIAEDRGVADFVHMLAATHGLTLYISHRPDRVGDAEPAGRLTPTERQTIDTLAALGGRVTVSTFAHQMQLQVTAAGNRLSNLADRGYLQREQRSRREGDEFVDPRSEAQQEVLHRLLRHEPPPMPDRQPPRTP